MISEGRAETALRIRAPSAGVARRPGAAGLGESSSVFIGSHHPGMVRAPSAKALPLDEGLAANRTKIGKLTLALDPESLPGEK